MVLLTKESLTRKHTNKLLSIVQQKNLGILRYSKSIILEHDYSVCIVGSAAEHEEKCNGGHWWPGLATLATQFIPACVPTANTATAELPPDPCHLHLLPLAFICKQIFSVLCLQVWVDFNQSLADVDTINIEDNVIF